MIGLADSWHNLSRAITALGDRKVNGKAYCTSIKLYIPGCCGWNKRNLLGATEASSLLLGSDTMRESSQAALSHVTIRGTSSAFC